MKYNQQFEEIIQKLLPLIEIGSSPEILEKDILTLIDIYKKKIGVSTGSSNFPTNSSVPFWSSMRSSTVTNRTSKRE